jgi:hypothetical protein
VTQSRATCIKRFNVIHGCNIDADDIVIVLFRFKLLFNTSLRRKGLYSQLAYNC